MDNTIKAMLLPKRNIPAEEWVAILGHMMALDGKDACATLAAMIALLEIHTIPGPIIGALLDIIRAKGATHRCQYPEVVWRVLWEKSPGLDMVKLFRYLDPPAKILAGENLLQALSKRVQDHPYALRQQPLKGYVVAITHPCVLYAGKRYLDDNILGLLNFNQKLKAFWIKTDIKSLEYILAQNPKQLEAVILTLHNLLIDLDSCNLYELTKWQAALPEVMDNLLARMVKIQGQAFVDKVINRLTASKRLSADFPRALRIAIYKHWSKSRNLSYPTDLETALHNILHGRYDKAFTLTHYAKHIFDALNKPDDPVYTTLYRLGAFRTIQVIKLHAAMYDYEVPSPHFLNFIHFFRDFFYYTLPSLDKATRKSYRDKLRRYVERNPRSVLTLTLAPLLKKIGWGNTGGKDDENPNTES